MPIIAKELKPTSFRYLDINTNYGENGQGLLLSEAKAINNQIFNLLTTYIGEADYEPTFGSLLPSRLFDLLPGTATLIETDLYLALNRWLGDRIQIDMNDVRAIPNVEARAYDVYLKYVLPARNVRVDYALRLFTNQDKQRTP